MNKDDDETNLEQGPIPAHLLPVKKKLEHSRDISNKRKNERAIRRTRVTSVTY